MAHYLIIGSGRTAQHISYYLQALNQGFDTWSRRESPALLEKKLSTASHILVLISDSSIENFYQENLARLDRPCVHFSGALEIPGMISAHPLMTFSQNLYDLETYLGFPFVITSEKSSSEILPGFPNRFFRITPEQKARYHAYCVGSGNFTTLLWQNMNRGMAELGLPSDIHIPYMQRVFQNLTSEPSTCLTGPLARKDLNTVLKNDKALASDPFRPIYRAFLQVYFPEAYEVLQAGEK